MNIALALYELESELERELIFRNISFEKHDRLYFFASDYCPLFAQVTWFNCQTIKISSINDGIKRLKALGRNWSLFSIGHHRRAQLIQDGLPKIKHDPVPFLAQHPKHSMGGWTLLDEQTIICSPETTSRYPLGKIEFIENKEVPPSRAYLKLWEFFTVHCTPPEPGTTVIDMGSSPGGWSWVLSQMKLNVISVDKAPLEPHIASIPNITFLQESAFALDPHNMKSVYAYPGLPPSLESYQAPPKRGYAQASGETGQTLQASTDRSAKWLFSDIICYPERLLTLITKWMNESSVDHFVCTIKFQGKADFAVIDQFLQIPNSKIVHLYHNKHELMWWCKR
jgi:23S rRNA (cytidine2498-2'-O)-methyltransferase